MELSSSCSPVAPLPLTDGGHDPPIVEHLVLAAQRELPADLRLPRHVALASPHGSDMERAAGTLCEVGPIQEHAGVIDERCRQLPVIVLRDDVLRCPILELPLLGGKEGGTPSDVLDVCLVHEMGAIAAAPLCKILGGTRQHTLAAVAKDASPVALEEREVEAPGALLLGRIEGDPFASVSRCRCHVGHASARNALRRRPVDLVS